MRGSREHTPVPTGQSFRVLRWQRRVNEVHLLLRPGVEEKIRGEGARWHFHSAMELTWFERGKGVRLQKYKDGGLSDATTFVLDKGLSWKDPAGRTRTETELAEWKAARGTTGRMAPRGFPRDNRFD